MQVAGNDQQKFTANLLELDNEEMLEKLRKNSHYFRQGRFSI
jgi:hypothetical protein